MVKMKWYNVSRHKKNVFTNIFCYNYMEVRIWEDLKVAKIENGVKKKN